MTPLPEQIKATADLMRRLLSLYEDPQFGLISWYAAEDDLRKKLLHHLLEREMWQQTTLTLATEKGK